VCNLGGEVVGLWFGRLWFGRLAAGRKQKTVVRITEKGEERERERERRKKKKTL
jgi:hypothetical protein